MLTLLLFLPVAQDVAETFVSAPRATDTATTSAIAVQTITGEELQKTGVRSLPMALAKASGLFVQETNLGGGAPIISGLIGNQILIVVDGVRLNDSTTRGGPNQSLAGIDPATIERIDVIRGPSSVLYGSDALGGALLIWTKNRPTGERAGMTAEALRLAGAFDGLYQSASDGYRASFEVSGATTHDGWLAIGSLQDWEDLESADGEVDNTGFSGQGWFGSWQHSFGAKHSLRMTASRTKDFDVPRTDRLNTGYGQTQPSDAEHLFDVEDRERYQLTYDDRESGVSDGMQVRLSLRQYLEERTIRSTGSSTRRLESDETQTLGLAADWRKALGDDHLFTWGFDIDHDDVDSTRNDVNTNTGVVTPKVGSFAPDSEYLSTGVFIQDEIFAFEPFALTAGLRYSYFEFEYDDFTTGAETDGDFSALTGSLQAARDVAQGVRVSASIGQAYRAPNLADVARNGTFHAGVELANPDLDPEESLYEELALDLTRPTWSASFSVFHNEIKDQIARQLVSDPTPGVPGDEIYLRVNSGDVEYFGAAARYRQKLGGGSSPYALGAYIEYTQGEIDELLDPSTGLPLTDEPATRVPPLHGYVALLYEPAQPWHFVNWADLSLWWADEQDELSPFDEIDLRIDPNGTDGWVRLDFDVGGPIGAVASGATWTLGVHNILDEDYRVHGTGFDAAGVGLVAGVHVSL